MKSTQKLLIPLATMGVAAAVTVGSGANWSSTTGPQTLTATAGQILTTMSPDTGTVALDIGGLQPGDTEFGTVTISNEAPAGEETLDGTLEFQQLDSDFSEFTVGATSYLTIKIEEETETGLSPLTDDAASELDGTDLISDSSNYDSGDTRTFRFTATLAANAPDAVQGAVATATYKWTATADSGQEFSWNDLTP